MFGRAGTYNFQRMRTAYPGSGPPLCACEAHAPGSPLPAVALETEVSLALCWAPLGRLGWERACVPETLARVQGLPVSAALL